MLDSVAFLVLTGVVVSVTIPVLINAGAQSSAGTTLIVVLFVAVIPLLVYWYVPVALTGKTLGKKILGIRVVRADDMRSAPGWGWTLARMGTSWALNMIPLFIGQIANLTAAGVDDESRALHDRVARTRVINAHWTPTAGSHVYMRPNSGSAVIIAVVATLVVALIIPVLAAIAIPVFLNQRVKGVEFAMRKDADTVARAVVSEAEAGRITAATFPVMLAADSPGAIGSTAITTAPGNSIVVSLIPGPEGQFCVRVNNDGAHAPMFLNSGTGTIDHTPCDGSTPTAPADLDGTHEQVSALS